MRAKDFLRKVIAIINRPEMRILPGQLAFFLVLSFIPILALVGSIASSFGLSIDVLRDALTTAVPTAVVNILLPNATGLDFNMIVFLGAAFILASNGAYSIITTSNEIYKVRSKGEFKRRLKAIVMTFLLVSLFLFLILVPAFGDLLMELVKMNVHSEKLSYILEVVYGLCKYPVSFLILYFNIKLIYTLAPDKEISSKSTIPGAIFTSLMWLLSSKIYAFYVEYFSHYDIFYGSMSNVLILLFWVYILAYIFILGMTFNATGVIQETLELKKSDLIKEDT